MTKRAAACLAAVAAILVLAVGCSAGGTPQAAAPPTTVTVTATATKTEVSRVTRTSEVTVTVTEAGTGGGGGGVDYVVPAGFDDWGGGLATMWSADDSFECDAESDSCWGIELYTDVACAAGVYINLDLMRDDAKIDTLDATTSPRPAGEYVSLVLGQSGNGTGLTARITDVRCTG